MINYGSGAGGVFNVRVPSQFKGTNSNHNSLLHGLSTAALFT